MRILLDTHIFLWAITEPERLRENARNLLENRRNQLYFSAASSWEISIKAGIGKLPLIEPPDRYIEAKMIELRAKPLEITHEHTYAVYKLPSHHKDPFDRLLIATAIVENLNLMSADEKFHNYDINLIWGKE